MGKGARRESEKVQRERNQEFNTSLLENRRNTIYTSNFSLLITFQRQLKLYQSHETGSRQSIPHFDRFVSATRDEERPRGWTSFLLVLHTYNNTHTIV